MAADAPFPTDSPRRRGTFLRTSSTPRPAGPHAVAPPCAVRDSVCSRSGSGDRLGDVSQSLVSSVLELDRLDALVRWRRSSSTLFLRTRQPPISETRSRKLGRPRGPGPGPVGPRHDTDAGHMSYPIASDGLDPLPLGVPCPYSRGDHPDVPISGVRSVGLTRKEPGRQETSDRRSPSSFLKRWLHVSTACQGMAKTSGSPGHGTSGQGSRETPRSARHEASGRGSRATRRSARHEASGRRSRQT